MRAIPRSIGGDMDDEIVQRISEIFDIAAERRNHAMAPDSE